MIRLLDGEVGAIQSKYGMKPQGKVIDLGGGQNTLPQATVVFDLTKSEDSLRRYIVGDLCDQKNYEALGDKEFDWAWCNHTLEDLYDPFIVLEQIKRIAKKALIGVPHWTREITTQSTREDWELICGWPHHFWFVGINRRDGALEFYPKLSWVVAGNRDYTTPNINLEWDGGDLPYRNILFEYHNVSLRSELVAWLEERWLTE